MTLISFRLSLRHWVLFVCRCAIWFPFVFRFVIVLLLGCWFLFVCRCGVWCDGLISAVARRNGHSASGNLSRSVVSCRRVGVEAMREFRRIMVDLHSGKKRVYESRVSTEMIATFCVVFFRSGVQGHRSVGETFFELEEEDQQRRQTFPWNAWKRTLIKAMERSSFG